MYKKGFAWMFAILLVLLSSCQNRPQYDLFTSYGWEDFGEPIKLTGHSIDFDEEVKNPTSLLVVDSFLLTKNYYLDKSFFIYNLNSKKKQGERIVVGNGPNEMVDPIWLRFSDDELGILDREQRRLDVYNQAEFLTLNAPTPYKSFPIKELLINPAVVPGLGFVSATFDTQGKLVAYDFDGNLISYFGSYPEGYEEYPIINKFTWFEHSFAVQPEGTHFIVAHMRTDMLEFYDKDLKMFRRIQGPDGYYPAIDRSMEPRYTYFSPESTKDCFYVLYDGRVLDINASDRYLRKHLLAFDWEGNPLKHYELSEGIITFSIDYENNVLYGVTDYPEFHIVAFPMNE